MLSIGVMSGGQGRYYQDLAREDYYLNGGEPVGKWHGKGAEHFGLDGEKVKARDLEAFLKGFSPAGAPLVQNAGSNAHLKRRPGFDLAFSAPKTVSAFWATATPEERKEIQAAQEAAVKAALDYLQKTATFTRTGKGGVNLHKAAFAAALFEHGTSRALDPQLHTHALLMNFGLMLDGRTRALVHTEFFAHKMTAGAVYRVQLAAELQKRLGLSIEQDPHAYKKGGLGFKMVGVSEKLCDFWSKRRDDVVKQLGEWGVESAVAAAAAVKATRVAKDVVPPRGELFERWTDEARSLGAIPKILRAFRETEELNPNEAFDLALAKTLRELTAAPESRLEAKTVGGRLVTKMVDAYLGGDDERAFGLSHFNEALLLRRLAENCQGKGIDAKTLLDKFAHAVENSPSLIRLGKTKTGEHLLTTAEVVQLEEKMLKSASALNAVRGHGVPIAKVAEAIKKYQAKHPTEPLTAERKDAVKYLTRRQGGSVRCLEGFAGTAKTSILTLVKELYEKQGYTVIGTAVNGKAVKVLNESAKKDKSLLSLRALGHHAKQMARAGRGKSTKKYQPVGFQHAYTLKLFEMISSPGFADAFKHHLVQIARQYFKKSTFKYEPLKLGKKTVVICDEASMVDTRQMAMLTERVQKAGGILIFAGDRDQIQAIGQGGGFSHVADKFGKASIKEIVRQKDKVDREAVKDMVEGKTTKVLKSFADRNLLAIEKDKDQAIDKLVGDWMKHERGHKKRESLIFVGTNKDGDSVNQQCQQARLDAGEFTSFARTSLKGQTFYRGDRVLFHAKSRSIGVENGETGTIVAINPTPILKTLTVKLDDGKKVVVPLRDYKDISLGYAVTTHKGQGSTVERAYVLLGGAMQDKELSYVQVSRAKRETRLYTTEAEAGEQNKDLAKQMAKSHEKTLAHAKVVDLEELRQERTRRHTMEK